MAKLTIKIEGQPDAEIAIEGTIRIGRKSSNAIMLKDNICSREHAAVIGIDAGMP